jgi:hypothetical protein
LLPWTRGVTKDAVTFRIPAPVEVALYRDNHIYRDSKCSQI